MVRAEGTRAEAKRLLAQSCQSLGEAAWLPGPGSRVMTSDGRVQTVAPDSGRQLGAQRHRAREVSGLSPQTTRTCPPQGTPAGLPVTGRMRTCLGLEDNGVPFLPSPRGHRSCSRREGA